MRRLWVGIAFFGGLLALWQVLSTSGAKPSILFPPPSAVFRYLVGSAADGTLLSAVLVTLRRLGTGYAIGLALGLPLGFLTARFRMCADTIGTLALGLQTLPSVCWAPLAILWFGLTESAMLFIVVMGTVWSMVIGTDHGIRSVPPIYARAARTMGSKRLHLWLFVVFPASLPFVVTGMKQGWAFAWRSLMAAEICVAVMTGTGLGLLLQFGREFHAMEQVLGLMVVIILVGLLADLVLFAPAERFVHRRWGTGT